MTKDVVYKEEAMLYLWIKVLTIKAMAGLPKITINLIEK